MLKMDILFCIILAFYLQFQYNSILIWYNYLFYQNHQAKMPFTVKTYTAPSKLHGTGLFAGQDIPKGHIIWTFLVGPNSVESFCGEISENTRWLIEQDFKDLTVEETQRIINHTWAHHETQKLLLMVDGSQWMNHSEEENSQYIRQEDYTHSYSIATRDIQQGEQIVENYGNYKKTSIQWVRRLLESCDQGRVSLQESIRKK